MGQLNVFVAVTALAIISACASSSGQRTPDEFRVVKKAPLVVPPEYQLRPPAAGQALPSEIVAENFGSAAFGSDIGSSASVIEQALVADAGAMAVSPVIRAQVDYEEAKVIRKGRFGSDRVLNWLRPEQPVEDSATGGDEVIIEQDGRGNRKLPGT